MKRHFLTFEYNPRYMWGMLRAWSGFSIYLPFLTWHYFRTGRTDGRI